MPRKKVDKTKLNLNKIGGRLALIRLEKGLSQEEFGKYIGITKGNISFFESYKYEPSFQVLVKIIEQFNINTDWLMIGEGEMFRKGQDDTYINNEEDEKVLDNDPFVSELLVNARKILKSGNRVVSEALERNILYFSHAAEMEKRLESIETQLTNLELRYRDGNVIDQLSDMVRIRNEDQDRKETLKRCGYGELVRIRKEDLPESREEILKQRVT